MIPVYHESWDIQPARAKGAGPKGLRAESARAVTGRRCPTLGQHWLLKQFSLNHPVEHIQKPKLPKLYVRVETSTSYFIIHNQFVK